MMTPTLTARLIVATTAAATTLVLFSSVVALAEPQRSLLMAKTHLNAAPPTYALASSAAHAGSAR